MIQKDYISKNLSKFLIKYHVIFVCKYRKKLLIGASEMSVRKPSRSKSKTKGSCATPHFSSPKLKI